MTAQTAHPDTASLSVPEILLMLRAPGAGWLATLLAALDEAQRDPDFDVRQRNALLQLVAEQGVPSAVADAARRRACAFEAELEQSVEMPLPQRHADVA